MPRLPVLPLLAALATGAALVSCSDSLDDTTTASPAGFAPARVELSEVVTGLDHPTQLAWADDGRLLVAQLNGAEGDGTGQILAIDLDAAPDDTTGREVLADGLAKPTGVAMVDGTLWVMEQDRLSAGPPGGGLTVVVADLPSNGRSEGTLTPTGDGGVYYTTTASRDGDAAVPGSGILWRIAEGEEPTGVARGLKNAYAHVVDDDGGLWSTEIGDGRYDGAPAPDELLAVTPGDDFGWPVCIGNRTPVVEHGGDEARCGATPTSHALFEPGATPTSVAVAPWDPEVLVVALWNRGEVVTVPRTADGAPHRPSSLIGGIDGPQHLLADGDRLLLSEHLGGRILALRPTP